jgi:purine-binding chemotaxis protein CheW
MERKPAPEALSADAGKHLTFTLCGESYGIPVMKVREIINVAAITAVPQMPPYIKGVVNLRGKIVPIMDMRLKFDMSGEGRTGRNCVIVAQVASRSGGVVSVGLVVDAVEEVCQITPEDIEEIPEFGGAIDTSCMVGMAKIKGKVIVLLNIDRVIGNDVGEGFRDGTVL